MRSESLVVGGRETVAFSPGMEEAGPRAACDIFMSWKHLSE